MNKKILFLIFVILMSMTKNHATKIRNNFLYFTGNNKKTLIIDSFKTNDQCISKQQPFSKFVDVGHSKKKSFLKIKAGRKNSNNVVACLSNRLLHDNMKHYFTFNHKARWLNFAFKGDLTINSFSKGSSMDKSVTFENIIVAQGRSGLSNNWWIGGVNCRHAYLHHHSKNINMVECTAKDKITKWCFFRGDTDNENKNYDTPWNFVYVSTKTCKKTI